MSDYLHVSTPCEASVGCARLKTAYWPGIESVRLECRGSEVETEVGAEDGGSGTEVGDTGSWAEAEDTGSGAEVEDTGSEQRTQALGGIQMPARERDSRERPMREARS